MPQGFTLPPVTLQSRMSWSVPPVASRPELGLNLMASISEKWASWKGGGKRTKEWPSSLLNLEDHQGQKHEPSRGIWMKNLHLHPGRSPICVSLCHGDERGRASHTTEEPQKAPPPPPLDRTRQGPPSPASSITSWPARCPCKDLNAVATHIPLGSHASPQEEFWNTHIWREMWLWSILETSLRLAPQAFCLWPYWIDHGHGSLTDCPDPTPDYVAGMCKLPGCRSLGKEDEQPCTRGWSSSDPPTRY